MNEARILSQGSMDSTCFLYAIANAYKSLVYPRMSVSKFRDKMENRWNSMVKIVPSGLNSLGSDGTVFELSDAVENRIFIETIISCFNVLSDNKIETTVELLRKKEFLEKKDYSKSAVIFCSKDDLKNYYGFRIGGHWYSVSLFSDFRIYVNCSYVRNCIATLDYSEKENSLGYFENTCENGRYYNDLFLESQITTENVWLDSFFEISIKRRKA